ncbi:MULTISPECIES: hypothetical protein [Sphingobium]|jgi:hypothetical protein|uniref:hypothetical protein n=1 Tax=Sphingobium TaxID=165695 RepID=UPI0010FA3F91|nr:hypothetical protein [Sphingobium sp. RSMS]UXC92931.1 hypothetical protein EGM87_21750 [Sphingobium sp. RSMS]
MVRVYDGCIEPGDMELNDECLGLPCPTCEKLACHHYFQQFDGGRINLYHTIDCDHCGHSSGYEFLGPP